MWDWGTQPFATVITTFVFSTYISSGALFGTGPGDDSPVGASLTQHARAAHDHALLDVLSITL